MNRFILTPYYLVRHEAGLDGLAEPDWHLNMPAPVPGTLQERIAAIHRPLSDFVADAVADGHRPVSFAGDCLSSLGVLAGLQRAGVHATLIWFDAHGDFNTWHTTPSGFLGGMPLAMLVGRGEQTIAHGVGLAPLQESRVILTDGRDLDPGEADAVASSDIVHQKSVADVLDRVPDGPLYVHFDTDVVDPAEVPAMNYPAPGGPSADEVAAVLRGLAATGRVVAASLSAWSADKDTDGRSREVSMRLFGELY